MSFTTDYRVEDFVLQTRWDDFPLNVQEQARLCTIDLVGALLLGVRAPVYSVGRSMVEATFQKGNIAVLGDGFKSSALGAAIAMGHASNAYDLDDGHNITRTHPGSSFVSALMAASYDVDCSLQEFMQALVICYEITQRMGAALMEYYQFPHSSGTFGAVGSALAWGQLYGLNKNQINMLLSVSEFNAPLVPGIRSVEFPSMNKDGVAFGTMIGLLAFQEVKAGFTGNKNMLERNEFSWLTEDLGQNYQIMDLYFKGYPCCRWVHPAFEACKELAKTYNFDPQQIEEVEIESFERATLLSKIIPSDPDEAQYNIAYPVSAMLVRGKFGMEELQDEAFSDPLIIEMMKKLKFIVDPDMEAKFPQERLCRVTLKLSDGRKFKSSICKAMGEAGEVDRDWIKEKFESLLGPIYGIEATKEILLILEGRLDQDMREIINKINELVMGGM
ncbi:MAG: MmgE/PrpD family protein [Tissierellia bacterium]|nr:MmgE/PrpD family protein [Tissierellia bacterium]